MSSLKSRGASGMTTSFALTKMRKPPNGSKARAHHEKRRVAAKIVRRLRCFVCIEICRAREQEPGREHQRTLDQGRIREWVRMSSDRDIVVLADDVAILVRRSRNE